jgi:hypothetical protein
LELTTLTWWNRGNEFYISVKVSNFILDIENRMKIINRLVEFLNIANMERVLLKRRRGIKYLATHHSKHGRCRLMERVIFLPS